MRNYLSLKINVFNLGVTVVFMFCCCSPEETDVDFNYSLIKETWIVESRNENIIQKDYYDAKNNLILSISFDGKDTATISSNDFDSLLLISSIVKNFPFNKVYRYDYKYKNGMAVQKIYFIDKDTFDITFLEHHSNGQIKKEIIKSIFDTIHPSLYTFNYDSLGNRESVYAEFYENDLNAKVFEYSLNTYINTYDPENAKLIKQIELKSGAGYLAPDTMRVIEYEYNRSGVLTKLNNRKIFGRSDPDSIIYYYSETGLLNQTISYFPVNPYTEKVSIDTSNFIYNVQDSLVEMNSTMSSSYLYKYITPD